MDNKYAGTCATCQKRVPPLRGTVRKIDNQWRCYCAAHSDLPAAPELPELVAPPADLTLEALHARESGLYPYQVAGVDWLSRRRRALLADDMGLGKTAQSLLALPRHNCRAIVICPASLKLNWREEIRRWRPDLFATVVTGKKLPTPKIGEIVIQNYESLPAKPAVDSTDCVLIVDEAHRVKNRKSLVHKKLKSLVPSCRSWLLTGTPIMTAPTDLAGILECGDMFATVFGHFGNFMRCYNARKGRYGTDWGRPNPEVPALMSRVMLRRTKKTVLPDLPAKRYQTIRVNGVPPDLMLQMDALVKTVEQYQTDLPPFQAFSEIRAAIAACKIPAMLDLVENYEDAQTPLVVFSAHRSPIDALDGRDGWRTITGDTPLADRQAAVADFQAGKLKGIAATISAGGTGLTLTAASTALFVDLDWTPALNAQAEDRICRIGQSAGSVQIVRMDIDHILDRHIADLITEKIRLFRDSIGSALQTA